MDDGLSAAPTDDFFRLEERVGFDPDFATSVLRGELACVVFRGHCPADECRSWLSEFVDHPLTRARTGDAIGRYLGTYHWGKRQDEYLEECRTMGPAVDEFLEAIGPENSWRRFERSLGDHLEAESVMLRPANWAGVKSATPLIRAWYGQGSFSLIPHEDMAQCSDPAQSGFEIQDTLAHSVCSVNMCIGNEGGGQLILWDRIPSDNDRRALGTEFTGGPYPTGFVAGVSRIELDVREGDLYIFNGSLVHAVASTVGQRATVSCLIGFRSQEEVVMWT